MGTFLGTCIERDGKFSGSLQEFFLEHRNRNPFPSKHSLYLNIFLAYLTSVTLLLTAAVAPFLFFNSKETCLCGIHGSETGQIVFSQYHNLHLLDHY